MIKDNRGGKRTPKPIEISEKLTKIYRPTYSKWATSPDGKELDGYMYNGYRIDIEDREGARNRMWGATHRWYNVTLKSGEKWSSDRLYDIKRHIKEEIEELNKKKR